CLRGVEVHRQLEFDRLLDREICRPCPEQNLINISSSTSEQVSEFYAKIRPPSLTNSRVAYIAGRRCCAANSTIKCRFATFAALAPTTIASGRSRPIRVKASL